MKNLYFTKVNFLFQSISGIGNRKDNIRGISIGTLIDRRIYRSAHENLKDIVGGSYDHIAQIMGVLIDNRTGSMRRRSR